MAAYDKEPRMSAAAKWGIGLGAGCLVLVIGVVIVSAVVFWSFNARFEQHIPPGSEGKYLKAGNPAEYTLLNTNGTFVVLEKGETMKGLFSIDGSTITLKWGLMSVAGEYKGNLIIDNEGNQWIREGK